MNSLSTDGLLTSALMRGVTEHAAFSSQSVNTAYCVMCLLISAKVQFC